MGRRYSERQEFAADVTATVRAVEAAFGECGLPTMRAETPAGAPVEIRSTQQMSMFSWGESVKAQIASAPGGGSQVVVESKLVFGLFDWGRNQNNVDQVLAAAARRLESD